MLAAEMIDKEPKPRVRALVPPCGLCDECGEIGGTPMLAGERIGERAEH